MSGNLLFRAVGDHFGSDISMVLDTHSWVIVGCDPNGARVSLLFWEVKKRDVFRKKS
jgi:hypothetical protein